jgi:NAD(P)-dependent dehydrogenase (short-subunit alcohol dehydrogenase family)
MLSKLVQRLLEPQEVAAIAVYLASDEAKSMTGQSINIDGGMVMH